MIKKLVDAHTDLTPENVKLVSYDQHFNSCLDLLLYSCRSAGLFRRKLLHQPGDDDVVLRLLVQAANRQLTGDSSHPRSELLQVFSEVKAARRAGGWPPPSDGSSTIELAASKYQVI